WLRVGDSPAFPSPEPGGCSGRERLSRDRGDRGEQRVLGGGGEGGRRDGRQDGARPADRGGPPAGPHDRGRRGRQLPRPPRDLVQVRRRGLTAAPGGALAPPGTL